MRTNGLTTLAMRHGRLRASKKRAGDHGKLFGSAAWDREESAVDDALTGERDPIGWRRSWKPRGEGVEFRQGYGERAGGDAGDEIRRGAVGNVRQIARRI